jgi:thioredoxin 1
MTTATGDSQMAEGLPYTTDETIDSDVQGDLPLLLDFGADWCEPCKALEPVVTDLARNFEGKLRVMQVDLDESPDIASRYAVMSIPTLLLIRDGEVVKRLRGNFTLPSLTQELSALLA